MANRRRYVIILDRKSFSFDDEFFNLLTKLPRALSNFGTKQLGDNGSTARMRFEQTIVH